MGGSEGGRTCRAANSGSWAVGIAFTDPTQLSLDTVELGHFTVAAIVDGNPSSYPSYPTCAVAVAESLEGGGEQVVTRDEHGRRLYRYTRVHGAHHPPVWIPRTVNERTLCPI